MHQKDILRYSYSEYLRNLSVRVVFNNDENTHQHKAASRRARGAPAKSALLPAFSSSFVSEYCPRLLIRNQASKAANIPHKTPNPTTRCNIGPSLGLKIILKIQYVNRKISTK